MRREGPMSIRRLAQQMRRDHVSVHSETSLLIQTGLIARAAEDEVRVGVGQDRYRTGFGGVID